MKHGINFKIIIMQGKPMSKISPRLSHVEVIFHGVLKLVWNDGYIGIVDLRSFIEKGKAFAFLQDSSHFKMVILDDYGHSLGWIDKEGNEIDLGTDSLRARAEKSEVALRAVG
jgi:Protein of unknown function (DUF2442)